MHEERKRELKGLKIQNFNYTMMAVACIMYIFVIFTTMQVSSRYDELKTASDIYITCEKAAAHLNEGSDYLTEQVRLYTVTGERQYLEAYFTETHQTKRREHALKVLEYYRVSGLAYNYLYTALNKSDQLMQREFYAMKLTATAQGDDISNLPADLQQFELSAADLALSSDQMRKKAQYMVFDEDYLEAKASIGADISCAIDSVLDSIKTSERNSQQLLEKTMHKQRLSISILFVLNILTFILIIALIVKPLHIYIQCIQEDKMLQVTGAYEFRYLALTYNDIYEINKTNEFLLRRKAEHDPLTGLLNRGAFEQLQHSLKVQPLPLALLLIDVDKFKNINDENGHQVGDLVLQKVANLLKDNFRASDYVLRIGGDEFAVIATEIHSQLSDVLQNKVDNMNRILQNSQDTLPKVSLSVGIAFSELGFHDQLFQNADSALYYIKEHGRCGCAFYHQIESQLVCSLENQGESQTPKQQA